MKSKEKRMATRRQIRAFRKNAQHSTGPRTPEGKARSSQNARKHGLFARDTVLPDENPEEFIQLIADLEQELEAGGDFERRLVRHIADAEWRMRRLVRLETGALMDQLEKERLYAQRVQAGLGNLNQQAGHGEENAPRPADPYRQTTKELGAALLGDSDNPVLLTLSLYESRLSRKYFSLLQQLRLTQKLRRAAEALEPEPLPSETHPSGETFPRRGTSTHRIWLFLHRLCRVRIRNLSLTIDRQDRTSPARTRHIRDHQCQHRHCETHSCRG